MERCRKLTELKVILFGASGMLRVVEGRPDKFILESADITRVGA